MNLKNSFILLVSFMVFFVLVIMFYKSIGRDKMMVKIMVLLHQKFLKDLKSLIVVGL